MGAPDIFSQYVRGLDGPYEKAASVTPSDSSFLSFRTLALWVGGVGDVALLMASGSSITLTAVPTGTLLKVRADKVLATGTTATLIVALG